MSDRALFRIASTFLAIVCGMSLLPLLVLILEFGNREFCGEAVWSYVAKLYGSYFLFPIFGVMAAGFLLYPLTVVLMILRDYPQLRIYVGTF